MKHTYKTLAVGQAKYEYEPSPDRMPVVISEFDRDLYIKQGWIVIGDVEMTVSFYTPEKVHAQRLDGLKAELQTVRAENQKRENAILDQISKLQALTFTEAA